MKIGTKSVLFGAHQFLIHPWFVAAAWIKLYGTSTQFIGYYSDRHNQSWDWERVGLWASIFHPMLWVCFFVHDIGYWGSPNMDGPEGEEHPRVGARFVQRLVPGPKGWAWHDFVLYHSRFLAKKHKVDYSLLCVADKLSIAITWRWLQLLLWNLSGEIKEYMARSGPREGGKYEHMQLSARSQLEWHTNLVKYIRAWAEEHKDGKHDTWTPDQSGSDGHIHPA
jgi:hypothetical protein